MAQTPHLTPSVASIYMQIPWGTGRLSPKRSRKIAGGELETKPGCFLRPSCPLKVCRSPAWSEGRLGSAEWRAGTRQGQCHPAASRTELVSPATAQALRHPDPTCLLKSPASPPRGLGIRRSLGSGPCSALCPLTSLGWGRSCRLPAYESQPSTFQGLL